MKAPWANKTGLAKLISIFSTVFVLTLGLCGVNFVAVVSNPNDGSKMEETLGKFFSITAGLEIIILIVCFLTLLILSLIEVFQRFRRWPIEEMGSDTYKTDPVNYLSHSHSATLNNNLKVTNERTSPPLRESGKPPTQHQGSPMSANVRHCGNQANLQRNTKVPQ